MGLPCAEVPCWLVSKIIGVKSACRPFATRSPPGHLWAALLYIYPRRAARGGRPRNGHVGVETANSYNPAVPYIHGDPPPHAMHDVGRALCMMAPPVSPLTFHCAVCLEHIEDPPVVFPCMHKYCQACVDGMITHGFHVCPMCRAGFVQVLSWRQALRVAAGSLLHSEIFPLVLLLLLLASFGWVMIRDIHCQFACSISVPAALPEESCSEPCRPWDSRLLYMKPADESTGEGSQVYICHKADFVSPTHAERLVSAFGPFTTDPALLEVMRGLAEIHERKKTA